MPARFPLLLARVLLPELLVMLVVATAAQAQAPDSADVRARLAEVLKPERGRPVVFTVDSAEVFPGARFFRGNRVPMFGTGEDPRPMLATLVLNGTRSAVVARWEDLPAAWRVLGSPGRLDETDALRTSLGLLHATRVIVPLLSAHELDGMLLSSRQRLGEIRPPAAAAERGGVRVRLFGWDGYMVCRFDLHVRDDGALHVDRTPLAEFPLHM
jgi:hypothetical protein